MILAEHVRDVYKGGEMVWRDSETDIFRMEEYFSKTKKYDQVALLVQDPEDQENYLLNTDIKIEDGEFL